MAARMVRPVNRTSSTRMSSSSSTEIALAGVRPQTHIAIVDAILYGDGSYIVDVLKHAVLPALALGLLTGGVFLRLVRVNMLQTLRAGYVDAARARGLSDGVVTRRHAFRNALVPVVTVMGMQIALLLGGAVLTETTFEWNGLGLQLARYLSARDFVAGQWQHAEVGQRLVRVLRGDVPEAWWCDPSQVDHLHGCGLSEAVVREHVRALVDCCGASALQLDDKPNLRQAFIDFARNAAAHP